MSKFSSHALSGLTLVEQIADELAHRILMGELAPGDRLRQDALAFEFGVSQAPVREAFARLERHQLVEALPRRGVRVTLLDPKGEREIAAMRAVIEPLALRSITSKPSPQQLLSIETALNDGDKAMDIYESEAANRAFHLGLAASCAMPRLIATIADLNFAFSRHVFASERVAIWRSHSNLDHARIFEAFARGRYEEAAVALAAHIRTVDRVAQSQLGRSGKSL